MIFSNNYKIRIPNILILSNDKTFSKLYDVVKFRSYFQNSFYSIDSDFYDNLLPGDLDLYDTISGLYDITLTDNLVTILNIVADFYDNLVQSDVDIYDTVNSSYEITITDQIFPDNFVLTSDFVDNLNALGIDIYDSVTGTPDLTLTDMYVNSVIYTSLFSDPIIRLSDRYYNSQPYTGGLEPINSSILYTSGVGIDLTFYGNYTEDQMNYLIFYNTSANTSVDLSVNFTIDNMMTVVYFNEFGDPNIIYQSSATPTNTNIRAIVGNGNIIVKVNGTTQLTTTYDASIIVDSVKVVVDGNGNSSDRYVTIPNIHYNIPATDFTNFMNNSTFSSIFDQW